MNEQKMPEAIGEKKSKRIINIIMLVLFVLSLLPYLMLAFYSISGVDFFYNTSYGFDAWFFVFIVYCNMLPVFPIVIIYQLFFMVFRFRKLSKILKKTTVYAIIATLILSLGPPAVVDIIKYSEAKEAYNKNKAEIEEYLASEFGKENFEDMRIILPDDADETKYDVSSPLLRRRFTITIDEDGISDNFDVLFMEQYDLKTKLAERLTKECDFPSNISISIRNINITDYSEPKNIDKILESCEYQLDYVTFHLQEYNRDNVVEQIKDFFNKYSEKLQFSKEKDQGWPNFLVRLNGKNHANIFMFIVERRNEVCVVFSGYKYEGASEPTIKKEDVYITFD